MIGVFFFSSRRRHTRLQGDWSSDVCSSDLGALDLLAGSDLGLLQRLDAGDFELLGGATALQSCGVQRLLARNIGRLDLLACIDLCLLDLTVRVDALGPLGGERDHTILVGELDCLLLLNVEYLAGLRGADSFRFE